MNDIIQDELKLEKDILLLIEEFNKKYPHLFVNVEHHVSTSNYVDYHSNYLYVKTWPNDTGKPILINH